MLCSRVYVLKNQKQKKEEEQIVFEKSPQTLEIWTSRYI